jgi:adenylylsulfate kinase
LFWYYHVVETRVRSIAKALSYRFFGSLSTVAVIFVLTGDIKVSSLGGALDAIVKIGLYFLHERLWAKIPFGRVKAAEYET